MATPFQERSPCQTASYPRVRRAFTGKAPCSALSSWRLTTSGSALANQAKRLSSRLLMLLMLKVATLTESLCVPAPLGAPPKRSNEFVIPAGIILPVEGNGKLRAKTYSVVLEVACLLKVSGFPSPPAFRSRAANCPNSISRVLSGCNSKPNFASRSRNSFRKRSASVRC